MSKERILVFNEETECVSELNVMLRSHGYEVIESSKLSNSSINTILEEKPDLLIISFKITNQVSVRDAINHINEKFDIPIICLISDDSASSEQVRFSVNSSCILKSPLKDGELLNCIEMLLHTKDVEKKLRESEERFKSLVENSSIGIFRLSTEGRILLGNNKFISLLGFDKLNQIVGKKIDEFLIDGQNNGKKISELIKTKEQLNHYKLELINSRKEKVFVSLSGNSVSWENEILYFDGTIQDITKQVKYEMELIEAKHKAEESDKLKTEFLAGMSHEIRTPINTIMSYLSLLNEDLKSSSKNEYEEIFEAIEVGSSRLTRTIDSILNMAQFQSGTFDTFKTRIDLLNEILLDIYHEFKRTADSCGLELKFTNEAKSTSLLGDKYSLSQLFVNLIDNGLKYTKQGYVEIKIYNDANGALSVDVRDTGIGISKEFLPILFKPFTQEEQGYTRKFDGNGLGLALVKRYCELNNGSISVNSVKNEGTCFTVVFKQTNKNYNYFPDPLDPEIKVVNSKS